MTAPRTDLPDRLDRFASWAALLAALDDDWLSVHDGRGRGLVHVHDGLGLLEPTGSLRARERRGLHRTGFRLQRSGDLRVWVWLLPDDPPGATTGDVVALLRRADVRGAALRVRALHVLRDVLRADLATVVAVVPPADDAAWHEGRDEAPCPGGGCPCGG